MKKNYFYYVRFCLTLVIISGLYSQLSSAAHAQRISLETKNATLRAVFRQLEYQSDYRFIYADKSLENALPVTISSKDLDFKQVLSGVFKGQPLTYQIKDKSIIIKEIQQQLGSITGYVTQQSNQTPMPGVTVRAVGKNQDLLTITDAQGYYAFKDLPYGSYQLSYNHLGYLTTASMVTLDKSLLSQNMNLVLMDAKIEQVVIIGYGSKEKRDITSSVSSITQDKLADFNNNASTFESILGGAAKGVMVRQSSGAPGATAKLNIRGITSPLSGSTNEPLYVIDGVPFFIEDSYDFPKINPLANIPISEIERIDILKDAAATAIYGSRGANGVILVKTKRGSKSKEFTISGDYAHSISNPTKMYKPLSLEQFKDVQNVIIQNTVNSINSGHIDPYEAFYNQIPSIEMLANINPLTDDGFGTPLSYSYEGLKHAAFSTGNTDWSKLITNKNARTNQANISLSGGTESTNLAFNFNTLDQKGIYINNGLNRNSARLAFDSNISAKLKAGATMSYSGSKMKYGEQLFADGLTKPWLVRPDIQPYDEQGNFSTIDGTLIYGFPVALSTPLAQLQNKGINNLNQFIGSGYAEYEVFKNFKLHGDISISTYNGDASIFSPDYAQDDFSLFGISLFSTLNTNHTSTSNQSINFRSDYSFQTGQHNIYAMAGVGFDRTKNIGDSHSYEEFPDNQVLIDPGSAARTVFKSYYRNDQGLNSFYSRLSYKYNNRYLAEANFRTDESSKFGPGNKRAYFPSLSMGWRINNETFMENQTWVNDLKLRASWGNTGSTNISNFLYRQFFVRGSNDLWGGKPAIVLDANLPNKNVKWEKTREYNLGIDYALFNNRLTGSIDLYDRFTQGALAPAPAPLESGTKQYYANIIDMTNKGFELEIAYDLLRADNFYWNASFNIARNKNEIVKLNGANISQYTLDSYLEGYPAGTRKGYIVDKIFSTQQEIDELNGQSPTGYYQNSATSVGDYKFKDLNGDKIINSEDREVIATAEPKYFGGLYNQFKYKSFGLSFVFQYAKGAKALMTDFQNSMFGNLGQSLNDLVYANMWTQSNPDSNAEFAKITYYDPASNSRTSDRFVYETSYLRLKNVNISFTLPQEIAKKWALNHLSIFASGSNLWTATKWPGLDPELVGNQIVSNTSSNDIYPLSKTFTLGLKVTY